MQDVRYQTFGGDECKAAGVHGLHTGRRPVLKRWRSRSANRLRRTGPIVDREGGGSASGRHSGITGEPKPSASRSISLSRVVIADISTCLFEMDQNPCTTACDFVTGCNRSMPAGRPSSEGLMRCDEIAQPTCQTGTGGSAVNRLLLCSSTGREKRQSDLRRQVCTTMTISTAASTATAIATFIQRIRRARTPSQS